MSNYIPLHVHDYYSVLDGGASPEEYMVRAKELGMDYLAQTNHGVLSGHRHFQRAAKEAGITPILGVEGYYSEDRFDRRTKAKREDGTQVYNHLTVLALNETGLTNLNKINKVAWTEGYYYKPRFDIETLFNNKEGLVVLSGCMSGMIAKALQNGDLDRAMRIAQQHKDALGDSFYIEVMATNPGPLNRALLHVADELGIKPVMTSDCHYTRKEDLAVEEALLILSTSPKPNFQADMDKAKKMDLLERFNYLYPERQMTFQEIEVYLRDYKTEKELFVAQGIEREDIFENTFEIAGRVEEYPYHERLDLLPRPTKDPKEMLRKLVFQGLKDRNRDTPEYRARAEEELKVIFDKNFEVYFLIVRNTVNNARKKGIRVGFGRGSGAGSLVNYALGITQVDPIKYNLLFFRFLDPTREDWPDVDIDFPDRRREEVKDDLRQTFTNVADISTISYFQGKSSIRDAARVLRIPLADVNRALKNNDASLAMNESYEYYDWFIKTEKGAEFNRKHPEVVELARKLHGKLKSFGKHASGIVASREPIELYAPIETAKLAKEDRRVEVVALDMGEVEKIGLIKLDILGLKALSVIDDTLNFIEERQGIKVDLLNLPMDDLHVYNMISKGHTAGIFQVEQPAYTGLILDMGGITTFDELVASNALVRPGAMNTIGPEYIARKNGVSPVSYVHEKTRYFTQDTYGLPTLYQEQQMLLCVELGGMTMQEANMVRRGLGKKDVEKIKPFKEKFIENASKEIGLRNAQRLWSDLEMGAEYNFNKSHSVAYSMTTYAMAYLKYYYPVEFMAATIRNESDKDSITDYLIEAKRMGIQVKLPHVNKSDLKAAPEGENSIRLGLTNIRYCGEKVAKAVLLHRPFKNYADLQEKVAKKGSGMNKRMLDSMNLVGAAFFPDNPRRGDESEYFYDVLNIPAFAQMKLEPKIEYQLIETDEYSERGVYMLRGMVRGIQRKDTWARVDILDEVGSISVFCDVESKLETGKMYLFLIANHSVIRAVEVDKVHPESNSPFVKHLYGETPEMQDGEYYTLAFKSRKTKAGKDMATIVAVDYMNNLHAILVWPSDYELCRGSCNVGMKWKMKIGEKEEDGTLYIKTERASFRRPR